MQYHTPNNLLNIQRWMDYKLEFARTKQGRPYYKYKGVHLMWSRKRGFMLYITRTQKVPYYIPSREWQRVLEVLHGDMSYFYEEEYDDR